MLVNFISALGRNAINFGRALGQVYYYSVRWLANRKYASISRFLLNNYTFSVCNRY